MTQRTFRLFPDGSPGVEMRPSNIVPPEEFTTADHSELDAPFFANPDESVLTGVWECVPCKSEIESYPVHEMMTVISGAVTVTNADGTSESFTSGDVFFIAKGTKCTWEITQTLRKFYMMAT